MAASRVFEQRARTAYLLRSESPGFPETAVTPELLAKRLLGRVVWVLQEL